MCGYTNNISTYGWCSSEKMVNQQLWAEGEPQDPASNHCVALVMMEDEPSLSGLEAVHCAYRLPLICQFPLT